LGYTEDGFHILKDEGAVVLQKMVDNVRHSYLWKNGEIIDIGSFGGMADALAINNSDQIVDGYKTILGDTHAFLF